MTNQTNAAMRKGELYCIFPIPLPMKDTVVAYGYVAVERSTGQVIDLGVESSYSAQTLIIATIRLLESVEFRQTRQRPFVIIVSAIETARKQMEEMLKPEGGRVVFDPEYFRQVIDPIKAFLTKQPKNSMEEKETQKNRESANAADASQVLVPFVEYVLTMGENKNSATASFLNYVTTAAKKMPTTSNPHLIGKYLYNKLDHHQTLGYKMYMIRYWQVQGAQLGPALQMDEQQFMEAIGSIDKLQMKKTR